MVINTLFLLLVIGWILTSVFLVTQVNETYADDESFTEVKGISISDRYFFYNKSIAIYKELVFANVCFTRKRTP